MFSSCTGLVRSRGSHIMYWRSDWRVKPTVRMRPVLPSQMVREPLLPRCAAPFSLVATSVPARGSVIFRNLSFCIEQNWLPS